MNSVVSGVGSGIAPSPKSSMHGFFWLEIWSFSRRKLALLHCQAPNFISKGHWTLLCSGQYVLLYIDNLEFEI